MKSEELMTGDWVMNTHNQKPEQVCEIRERMVMLDYNDLYDYEEIEPIPLTPEILERVGFTVEAEQKYEEWYEDEDDDYIAKMKCVDVRKCNAEIEYKTYGNEICVFSSDYYNILPSRRIDTQVEYVHELQHIMRLCGIEKEILL